MGGRAAVQNGLAKNLLKSPGLCLGIGLNRVMGVNTDRPLDIRPRKMGTVRNSPSIVDTRALAGDTAQNSQGLAETGRHQITSKPVSTRRQRTQAATLKASKSKVTIGRKPLSICGGHAQSGKNFVTLGEIPFTDRKWLTSSAPDQVLARPLSSTRQFP